MIASDSNFFHLSATNTDSCLESHTRLKLVNKYPISGFVSFSKLRKENGDEPFESEELDEISRVLHEVSFYTEPLEGHTINSNIELDFSAQSPNSLAGFMQLAGIMHKTSEQRGHHRLRNW